jgi:hypothetical protein
VRTGKHRCDFCGECGPTDRIVLQDHVPAGAGSAITFPREFRICKKKHDGVKLRAENARLYEVKV